MDDCIFKKQLLFDGLIVGETVGIFVGDSVGVCVGVLVGYRVGSEVIGDDEGWNEGSIVGAQKYFHLDCLFCYLIFLLPNVGPVVGLVGEVEGVLLGG